MATTLAGLDLAALLCSRVCHDLISPTGAIVNGLEVLEESKDGRSQEQMVSTPVFEGARMYYRSPNYLYCIGQ